MWAAARRRRRSGSLPPGLHGVPRGAARESGVSLNEYCARKLALPAGNLLALALAVAVVERAAELFGEDLMAVIAFGSWSRVEAVTSSDVDVLVGRLVRRSVHGQPSWLEVA